MNISLDWLKEYLPGETEVQAAGDALMRGGLPVELIEPMATIPSSMSKSPATAAIACRMSASHGSWPRC